MIWKFQRTMFKGVVVDSELVVPNEKLSTTTSAARASSSNCCRPSTLCRSMRIPRSAPVPHPIPGLLRKWIAQRRLDTHDVSSVVGKEHRGHRAGHAPGQVENAEMFECSPAIRLHPFTFGFGLTIALTMSQRSEVLPFSPRSGMPLHLSSTKRSIHSSFEVEASA